MIRTTTDPNVARTLQTFLSEEMALYRGAIDGVWGPQSDQAYEVYLNFQRYAHLEEIGNRLSADQQADLAKFLKQWKTASARSWYDTVGAAARVPAELVAAIHWRESGGDFGTYLQNGDPLRDGQGNPLATTHVPKGLIFSSWITAARAALEAETDAYAMSDIDEEATGRGSLACLCIFAEYFNGEGYRQRGVPDPYVLAGTTGYTSGKYTADGSYDPRAVDGQLGVLVLLRAIIPSGDPA